MNSTAFIPLIFIVVFPLFWCGVSWVVSRIGGWSALAKYYKGAIPNGLPHRNYRSLVIRRTVIWNGNYSGVVTYQVDAEAIYLSTMILFRIGHTPIRLPFEDISIEKNKGVFGRSAFLTLSRVSGWTLILSMKDIDWIEAAHAEMLG